MKVTVDVTLPSEREIQVKRTFKTTAARLFECHSKPELVQKWLLGPPGSTMPVCNIDFRVGGAYRFVWRGEHHPEFGVDGTFLEIDAPHRIVQREKMEGMPGECLVTATFEETGNGHTTLTLLMDFQEKHIRDMVLQSGMTEGIGASHDRLEELF